MVSALGVNQAWLFTGVFGLGSALAGEPAPAARRTGAARSLDSRGAAVLRAC